MISHETIEAVRHQLSIVSVIGERVRLERRGQSHLGLCPFHKEKTPSFHVNAERGFFYCFGCQAGGNVISFVQQLDGLTFPEAVRALAERAGIEVKETGSLSERKQEAESRRRRDELYAAGSVAAEFFERCLEEHPLGRYARAELRRRRLDPEAEPGAAETLRAFRVGYAPYGWDGLTRHLRETAFNLRAAETVGLLGERKSGDGHYDRFRHRLMFAILDLQGRVIGFSGRALDEPTAEELARLGASPSRGAEAPAKYYNSPESPIYRKRDTVFGLFQARQAIRETDRAVVVEGNFDVVSLHARGIRHVVAPLGTAFTEDQAAQIQRYTSNVTFLFDGDAAGQRASLAAREPCQKQGLLARVARLPQGKDPDDLARQGGKAAVESVLNGAQPLMVYMADVMLQAASAANDAQARAATYRELRDLINSEADATVRDVVRRHAIDVAARLDVIAGDDGRSLRALRAALGETVPVAVSQRPAAPAPPERARSPSRVDEIRQQIFGAALEYPELLDDPAVREALPSADGELAVGLELLASLHAAGTPIATADDPLSVASRFPESLQRLVSMRLAAPQIDSVDAAHGVLLDNLAKLARLGERRQRASVVEELRRAAATGDVDAELSLLSRQLARAKARHGLE